MQYLHSLRSCLCRMCCSLLAEGHQRVVGYWTGLREKTFKPWWKVLALMEKWGMEKDIVKYTLCSLQVNHLFSAVPSGSFFSLADHQYQIKQSKVFFICVLYSSTSPTSKTVGTLERNMTDMNRAGSYNEIPVRRHWEPVQFWQVSACSLMHRAAWSTVQVLQFPCRSPIKTGVSSQSSY